MARLCLSLTLLVTLVAWVSSAYAATTYYVDCDSGSDLADGESQTTAWATLARANQADLDPGDSLLLKRGCDFNERLIAGWAGTASDPIVIGAYGTGHAPSIHWDGEGSSIYVPTSGAFQIIQDLKAYHTPQDYPDVASDCDNIPFGWRLGVSVAGHDNVIQNLLITENALGIKLMPGSYNNRITGNQIVNNQDAWAKPPNKPHWFGGAGMHLYGDGNVVDHNYFSGNHIGGSCSSESIAIELYGATGSMIHHNTTIGDRVFIEMGKTAEVESANNVVAYNVHYTAADLPRFLVTRGPNKQFGPVWNTQVYNNSVYMTGQDAKGIVCDGCTDEIITVHNNAIVAFKAIWVCGPEGSDPPVVTHNTFWRVDGLTSEQGFLACYSPDSTTVIGDPKFTDPANGDFHLLPDSPSIDQGSSVVLSAGFSTDIDGESLPQGTAVDMGADELRQFKLPGILDGTLRIEVEDYRRGGEGVGYHDSTVGNSLGECREDDVDIRLTEDVDGECSIGNVATGEWVAFDTFAESAQDYVFHLRLASAASGMSTHLEVDGTDVTGTIATPYTGDWQDFETVTTAATSIAAGRHMLALVFETNQTNVNWLAVTPVHMLSTTSSTTIEAEDYRGGGEGVGYHDTTAGNTGGEYRDDDVDIQVTGDSHGAYSVGWVAPGEWLAYDIYAPEDGMYTFSARVATDQASATMEIELDGTVVADEVIVDTGGWQSWVTVPVATLELTEGYHTLKVIAAAGSYNINYIEVDGHAWANQDIGSVGAAGDYTYDDGEFSVDGSGADIWGNADEFHFVYQPWSGDLEIVAKVTSIEQTDPFAKAGVMIRESLAAGSKHAFMQIRSGGAAGFIRRTSTNGSSATDSTSGISAPHWVKIVRSGNTFEGYRSSDGRNWTLEGSVTITMASNVYVGLAVTSHADGTLNTSTFESVRID